MGEEFPHRDGRRRPWRSPFSSLGCWSCIYIYGRISNRGGGRPYPPRLRRDLGIVSIGNLRHAETRIDSADQQLANKGGVSTPCAAISLRGITVVVPGLLELYMYGNIADPGMEPCGRLVRRDLDFVPRSKSRCTLAP